MASIRPARKCSLTFAVSCCSQATRFLNTFDALVDALPEESIATKDTTASSVIVTLAPSFHTSPPSE